MDLILRHLNARGLLIAVGTIAASALIGMTNEAHGERVVRFGQFAHRRVPGSQEKMAARGGEEAPRAAGPSAYFGAGIHGAVAASLVRNAGTFAARSSIVTILLSMSSARVTSDGLTSTV